MGRPRGENVCNLNFTEQRAVGGRGVGKMGKIVSYGKFYGMGIFGLAIVLDGNCMYENYPNKK